MKLRFLLLAVALLAAQPALPAVDLLDQARAAVKAERLGHAEQLLRQELRFQKSDHQARFLLARVLAWQGKRREALIEYDALIKADPRDGDYLLGKAQALVWDGKPVQALPLLKTARRIAPQYEEVWRLQITALIAVGDEFRLRQARTIRAMAAARFPRSEWRVAALDPVSAVGRAVSAAEPAALRPQVSPAAPTGEARRTIEEVPAPATASAGSTTVIAETGSGKNAKPAVPAPRIGAAGQQRSELELGLGSETLSNGLAPWRTIYLEGLHQFGERQVMYGTLRETRRFGLLDSEAQGGFTYPLGKTSTFLLEANFSPTHNVLPNFSLMGQLQREFDHGWNVQGGIRHSEYSRFNTNVAVITGERYWNSFRGAYSLYLARLDGGSTVPNHTAQLDYYYSDRNSIGVMIARGREIADLGPSGALITDVRSYGLRGRHWITPDWAISFEALHHEQGNLYARTAARIGLRRAF